MAAQTVRPQVPEPPVIRTPDQRLRVFISSTLEELAPERRAAREAVEHLRLTPVLFELGARPHPPRDLYRAYLDQSHVFVGIYGRQYGWVAPGESISGLEDEYQLSGYRPKLIYIKGTPAERDRRLDELLDRIRNEGVASYREFSTADELRELMENDLAVLLTERFEQLATSHEPAPTNVPVPRNPLVGRDRELALACELLRREHAHLVTLTGPGGCGKSRLGLQVALELLDHFEDGTFLVMLESISHPVQVVPAIAEVLGVREIPGKPRFDSLCDHLGDSHALLLLDNFEHVVSEAPTISMLLERCPELAVLATSRTPLRVRGERELPIPPLETPVAFDADLPSLSQYAAVALFIQRAQGAQARLTVTDENAPAIAEICHRLDGLPLAIELAAARLKILSPEALLGRLASRFEVLQGGTRDLPERHRTLRGAIDWSHDLLDEAERRIFRRLAVFAGGSILEAAEAVCAEEDDPGTATLDVIASLLDSSMLTTSAAEGGDVRIGMLDTIRAYAAERLLESGETQRIRRNHAEYYCVLCEEARPHLVGPDEPRWADRLRAERDNLRLALGWSVENDVELGLRLARSLFRFWEAHNMIVEGHRWLMALLARPSPPSHTRGAVLHSAAAFGCYLGDYDAARGHVSEALDIFERLGDERGVATALNELGVLASYEGDFAEARRLLEESLAIKRTLGDDWLMANAFVNLGNVAGWGGDHALGYQLHTESLALFEKAGERMGVAIANHNLASAAMHLGRLAEALERHVASLRLFDEVGDKDGCAESAEGLAMLANAHGERALAARLFGLGSRLREESGTQSPATQRAELERELDITRERLDQATFDTEWQAGHETSVEDAFELVGALARTTGGDEEPTR
jgi:predicted ATPase